MKVVIATSGMPFPPPAVNDGLRLNLRGLTWELLMSMGMWARMVAMQMRRKKHCKPMMDQCRMLRTEGIVEPVMSTGMRARMPTMRMMRKTDRKLTMDQRGMWKTEGIVLESVKIGQYYSDL
jgi:hypothetical protein